MAVAKRPLEGVGGREREGGSGREGGREGEAIILRRNAFTAHHGIHNNSKFTELYKIEHHPS